MAREPDIERRDPVFVEISGGERLFPKTVKILRKAGLIRRGEPIDPAVGDSFAISVLGYLNGYLDRHATRCPLSRRPLQLDQQKSGRKEDSQRD